MNSIVDAKKRRYKKFYGLSPEVKKLFHIHITKDSETNPPPRLWRENMRQRIDYAARAYELSMRRLEWLHDDFIPFAPCVTGTEIFAEACGSEVIKTEDSNPFALPFITEASEVSKVKIPKLEDSSLYCLFDMADEIIKKCGSGVLLTLPDVQTPMDIAALIWDKNYLFIAMVEEPEAVKELAHKISVLYYAFFDEWFKRYGTEFMAHCPDYYMPSGLTVSEDEIGSVSSAVFDELFLPELINITNRYSGIGIHCCANARHQWDNFKKVPKLKMLNLVQPYNVIVESTTYFAGHTAMFPNWSGAGEPETWFSQLDGNAHVLLDFFVQNEDKAKELAELFVARV